MGVMGKNLSLNIASKGHTIAVYNRDYSKTHDIVMQSRKENITTLRGYGKVDSFVNSLESPRKIIVMVKAGEAVDAVIREIGQHVSTGDIIVDGGNEWYENTERRQTHVYDTYGVYLLGMGVSGGAEGARNGPSLMPSGNEEAFRKMEPILNSIAAKVGDGDNTNVCMSYIGTGGSGNYVKMIHNGIEYGVMQVIAEVYFIMKMVMKYSNEQIAHFFEKCNAVQNCYLLEITVNILRTKDVYCNTNDNEYLLDNILDSPKMNGTGTWTSKEGYETYIPIPNIHSAVDARMISSHKVLRGMLSHIRPTISHEHQISVISGIKSEDNLIDVETFRTMKNQLASSTLLPSSHYYKINMNDILTEDQLEKSLMTCMFLCYVQGFAVIQKKNAEKQWGIDYKIIADIWKGGCIIRNRTILDYFSNEVFNQDPYKDHEDLSDYMMKTMASSDWVKNGIQPLSKLISVCSTNYIPIPTLSSSFQYILQLSQKDDSSNLIQAQRDYFGAHGYERKKN